MSVHEAFREFQTKVNADIETVREARRRRDVFRSAFERLLVKYKYPPDKQPEAIKLVMDQMESMAPRYADERR